MEYCNEVWKDVQDYEGLYQVSNLGRVKSVDRVVHRNDGIDMFRAGKIKNTHDNGKGYLVVSLYKHNKGQFKYVHRLVAQAFITNPNNLPVIDHLNCNRADNKAVNLEWVTYSENNYRSGAVRHKNNWSNPEYVANKVAKMPKNPGVNKRKPVKGTSLKTGLSITFPSMRAAAKKLNGYSSTICEAIRGNRPCYGYEWEIIKTE